MTERAALGAFGERMAVAHLRRHGWRIVAQNVAVRPWGEIDIVAERGGHYALVEVRTRRGDRFGGAVLSIGATKRRRMLNAALAYLTSLGDEAPPARIDVILVELHADGRLREIRHIENAIEDDEG